MNYLRFNQLSFLLAFITIAHFSQAQDLLVTTKGETLSGKIKLIINGYDKRAQITAEDKQKKMFTILQVKAMTIDNEAYETVKFGGGYYFMKVVKTGYLSLYAFQLDKQLTFDGRYLLKKDGQGIELPNLGFKKNLSKFLEECTQVSARISDGSLGRNDLDKIIDEFNTCIAENSRFQVAGKPSLSPGDQQKLKNWDELQQQVEASALEGKADALDMIKEIKGKVSGGEKLPRFLVDGLKSTLAADSLLSEIFNRAIRQE